MTALAIGVAERAIYEQTLAPNVQDDVAVQRRSSSLKVKVRVTNVNGVGSLFFTTDGTDVNLASTKALLWLPAVAGARLTFDLSIEDEQPAVNDTLVVKLKSAAAVQYSVEVS